MELIRIPKRFYDDHKDRMFDAPEVVKETKAHYFIDATSEHLDELLSDASFYADPRCFDFEFGTHLASLILSARATEKAIEKYKKEAA
jgi:hypothetical protein|tara:strand:- start:98 stop:361 length:264 start_codon:yes stop_codon:yes gene_type:complete